jgi:hypothetical protein
LEFPVQTSHVRKAYPPMPFDIAESELSQELEIYYQAIHSYPAHFARTRMSFQQHLLNIMCMVQAASEAAGPERMKPAS